MNAGLLVLCALTVVIHLIGTLAYSVRIAGTRTGRIALSLSLFNILALVSRTANTFQGPLLAKRVEERIVHGAAASAEDFRWLLLAATLATALGALLIPTFQRLYAAYVEVFARDRSLPRLLARSLSPSLAVHLRQSLAMPRWETLTRLRERPHIPWSMTLLNMLATALWTVGVFAALYAGHLRPELRVTSVQLSAVVNGIATILMFTVVDPYLSVLTDDVAAGTLDERTFRSSIVWLVASRLAGTMAAQLLLVPAAVWITIVAGWL